MDDHSLLDGPEPAPQAGTAAEAFARLAARVETMDARIDGRLAVIARALEHIAVEKQSIEVPDYNPTLGKINANMAEFAKHMEALSQSEALRMTPENMADRTALKDMRELNRQTIAAMRGAPFARKRISISICSMPSAARSSLYRSYG